MEGGARAGEPREPGDLDAVSEQRRDGRDERHGVRPRRVRLERGLVRPAEWMKNSDASRVDRHGRGEFCEQETSAGRALFVRFIFSGITATTFRLEQALSADGGRSWEPDWIATSERDTRGATR